MEHSPGRLKELIRDVPDFPMPGVGFKDLTPLLADGDALGECVDAMAEVYKGEEVRHVLGIEARGFIFAAPVAVALRAGFVPVRKKGKLPWRVHAENYNLEYGTDTLEMHEDAIRPGERVLIVDDVLATGGTAAAVARMVHRVGAEPVGLAVVVELAFLGGRARIGQLDTFSVLTYE